MKRITTIILILISSSVFSQSMHGLTYSMALPVGETSDFISNVSWRGFTIDGKYFINDRMTLGWTTGWQTMYESESGTFVDGTQSATGIQYRYLNVLPILLTSHYFFHEDGEMQPFLGIGAGTFWIESKANMGLFSDTEDNWHFGLAPEAGILFPVSFQSNLYISLRYSNAFPSNGSITYSYLSLNVGFLWY
ncbi:MAG: hypothetical protein KFF73_20725 [Cyclobacteriaceae bacterium]|nr:hypothetical protein [Cyclobacteriaceae bacterium]